MEKIVYDKKHLTIKINLQSRSVYLEWKAFAGSSDYREGLNTALSLVKTHKLENWLANLRNMKAIRQEDQDWTNRDWFPQLAHSSLKKMAIVVSEDIFNQLAVDNIMQKSNGVIRFDTQYFNSDQSAQQWLGGVEKKMTV